MPEPFENFTEITDDLRKEIADFESVITAKFPGMPYFFGISSPSEKESIFMGNRCPVCYLMLLMGWIMTQGISHIESAGQAPVCETNLAEFNGIKH